MGLFDHLFKSKAPAGEEKVGEHAVEGGVKPTEAGPRTPTPQKADPSAFLHPKNYVPRGAPGLTPAPRPGSSGISKPAAERKPVATPPPAADEIVLTLGDVLSRIPTEYLKSGAHDPKRELRFKINDLSSDIARGRAAVPLSRITQLAPEIFARQVGSNEDMEIRLPLQKLVEQIGLLRSRPKTTAIVEKVTVVEKIARPVATADLPPAVKPVVPIEVQVEPKKVAPIAPPPAPPVVVPAGTEHVVRVMPPPPQVPSIVLPEPPAVAKPVELKPAAEQAAVAPVILGPSPIVESPPAEAKAPPPMEIPAVSVVPAAPAPVPTPAPVPAVAETKEIAKATEPAPIMTEAKEAEPVASVVSVPSVTPVVETVELVGAVSASPPVVPAPEPVSVVPPVPAALPIVPVVPSAAASEAQKIVIDWGADVPAKVEEKPDSGVPEIEIETPPVESIVPEPVVAEPAAEGPKLAPVESPDLDSDEEKIHLSLAAILKHCPPEILVGELPPVDDSVRITLPFAPIDRQLVKGHVEISALRFIVALPEIYHKHFVAKIGVKVPIPLEEVFQNLPSPKQELTPVNPTPPPVVLAPAAPAAPAAEVTKVPEPEELGALRVPPIVPLAPSAVAVEEKPDEAAAVVEAKAVESPTPAAPVEPPPLPVAKPEELTEVEAPAALVPAPAGEEPAPSIAAVPVAPFVDLPERLTAEQAAQPPLPTAADIAPAAVEPPPIPTVAAVIPETPPVAPATESAPPPLPIPAGAANAAPTGNEPPKLVLQPPNFRPHIIPPPRIFGFTPTPVAPEPEQPAKVEPPSVLAGLAETPAVTPASAAESAAEEISATAPPANEAGAAMEAVVGESKSAETVAAEAAIAGEPAAAGESTPQPGVEASESPKAPEPSPAPSDSEPSAELIAFAGEHAAPDIAHFSGEPVPFADLAESLAHETTYAPALAEVVHVDVPGAEPAEVKAAVTPGDQVSAAGQVVPEKVTADEAHRAVPIVEGLAVAAVAATIAEHVPLNFREGEEVVPAGESMTPEAQPGAVEHQVEEVAISQDETASEVSTPTEKTTDSPLELVSESLPSADKPAEDVIGEEVALPDSAPAAEMPSAELPAATEVPKAAEPPVSPAPATERPAAAVPPPPPHPLFPLPKIPSAPVHVEVLPPPSLPLRRFDQDAVQALFMTEETLDLPKISYLAAALPGVYACVIATRDQACTGGTLPEGFDLAALLGLAPRVGEAAGRMPIGQLKHFTLYGDAYSVSFFERNGLSLCAVHRPRSFVPGVREKLVALADELSR